MKKFFLFFKRFFPTFEQWCALRPSFFWAIVSACLLWLPFPPIEWGWIAFFGLAPFLAQLPGRTAKEGAWIGLIFGYFFFQFNMLWLNTLVDVNPMAPFGIALAALICATTTALFGGVVAWASHRLSNNSMLFFAPALWVAIEYLRAQSEWAFPWMYLGHTQVNVLPLIQICDITGVYGVSFLIALTNQTLADAWRLRRGNLRGVYIQACIAAGLALLFVVYGQQRLKETPPPSTPYRVAILQMGVPQKTKLASYDYSHPETVKRIQEKIYRSIEAELQAIHADCTQRNGKQPALVVFPESAVTFPYFNIAPNLLHMTFDWATTSAAPLFFGADRFDPAEGITDKDDPRYFEEGKSHNSAYLVRPGEDLLAGYYDKMHLVPFGEYGSYLDIIPGFTNYILGIGNFEPGRNPRLFEAGGKKFGCGICFESCFPYLFRQYPEADFVAVITNDAWYKLSSGARRHQTQAIFRAIEMRRPVVRAANTGISCVIDPQGRVLASLPLDETKTGHIVFDLPLPNTTPGVTPYMRAWGDWLSWLCLLYCAARCCLVRRKPNEQEIHP
ncbi:TPA: apolipoprotein N-acyltransferase [Candidatus Sumerlaeota bacterium]|nr:apolipoprotein N-acyltransferase [Candidatus Sumerlaeota bacterium]